MHRLLSEENLLRLDGEVALGEVGLLLSLLLGDKVLLVLGHSPADGASLLGAEVERQVLLALVEDAELGALVGVDDGEDAGDRLADVVDLAQLRLGTTGNLLGAQGNELLLQLIELLLEIILVLAPKLLGSDLAGRHCE